MVAGPSHLKTVGTSEMSMQIHKSFCLVLLLSTGMVFPHSSGGHVLEQTQLLGQQGSGHLREMPHLLDLGQESGVPLPVLPGALSLPLDGPCTLVPSTDVVDNGEWLLWGTLAMALGLWAAEWSSMLALHQVSCIDVICFPFCNGTKVASTDSKLNSGARVPLEDLGKVQKCPKRSA